MNVKLLILICLPLGACNTVNRLTGGPDSRPAENHVLPDVYEVTGVTAVDRQTIQPVRVVGSSIEVWVSTPGAAKFRQLNYAEYYADEYGPGGGGVWLKGEIIIQGGIQYPQGRPAAPTGSRYRIRSTLN